MAFLESQLDPKITAGATGGPVNPARVKVYSLTGKLQQTFLASRPVHRYDISHGLRQAATFQTLLDFWYVVHFTPFTGFRFKDWRDYIATQANSRCTQIGGGSTFQLQRVYSAGGNTWLRNITKPCTSPTVTIYRNRSGVITTAVATVDSTTGIATISSHSAGDTYTWEGQFDVPVTFTDDEWTGALQSHTGNLLVQAQSIKLEELL